ncbi:hypothetical protein AVEN_5426-1 [Araneus ventricosus]|uniref:Uncharacterized protein n=1 Tax=Araneus ventricosus TaxID=182803 RepID=A0A4Y2M7G7_ARAVE|nr:hypothetical protein AVEN_5426-1 [Araneus ventricosus]
MLSNHPASATQGLYRAHSVHSQASSQASADEHWSPSRHTAPSPTDAFGTIEFQGSAHPLKAQLCCRYAALMDEPPLVARHIKTDLLKMASPEKKAQSVIRYVKDVVHRTKVHNVVELKQRIYAAVET